MTATHGPGKVARLVQITDLHLGSDRYYRQAGIATYTSLTEVLAAIRAEAIAPGMRPDMMLVTGDIAAMGVLPAYELVTRTLAETGIPYAWLPGNHDDFQVMQEGIQASPYWPLLEMGDWRLISLNSAVRKQVGGHLRGDELEFLANALDREPANPTLVFMHHPPVPVGCAWLDRQRIHNAYALEEIVLAHSNVKAVFTGHIHQRFQADWAGTKLYSTPSTCFQFAPNSDDFLLDDKPPGYRWIDLYEDGTLETEVVYLENSSQTVDRSCKGY